MARHGFTKFGVILVIFIISQQHQFSNAQQCRVSCSQTGYKGKLRYSRALEVAQNREHELDDNFGPGDLDDIIRYRNKRSDLVGKNLKNCHPTLFVSKAKMKINTFKKLFFVKYIVVLKECKFKCTIFLELGFSLF